MSRFLVYLLALLLLLAIPAATTQGQNYGNINPRTIIGNPSRTAKQPAQPMPMPGDAIDVRSFGAKCDGTTDDTAALQAAAAVPYVALIPGKTCIFKAQLKFTPTSGAGFLCPGWAACTLTYAGASTTINPILFASNVGPFGAAEIVAPHGGTAYAAGDTITLNDGCATHAQITIATVQGGIPTSWRISNMGSCAAIPATFNLTQLTTSGGGTGANFDMYYGSLGTVVNYPTLSNIVLATNTAMTLNAFVRFDGAFRVIVDKTRLYGNNKMYQGMSINRTLTADLFDGSIENTLAEALLTQGTGQTTPNAAIDIHLRNQYLNSCQQQVTTKAIANSVGCWRIGDNVGGIFTGDKVEIEGHNGYGIFFQPTVPHTAGNNLSSLANFNGLNIEATGSFSGGIAGINWTGLEIGGTGTWITGNNLPALNLAAGAPMSVNDVRVDGQFFISQSDASQPAAIVFNGVGLYLTNVELGGYSVGAIGLNLGSSAGDIFLTGVVIQNLNVGINGTTNTGGIKTLVNVNFRHNNQDFAGLGCADFQLTAIIGTTSAGGILCSGPPATIVNATRDLTAASGTQTITGFTYNGANFIPNSCDVFGAPNIGNNYSTYNGHWTNNAQSAFYGYAGVTNMGAGNFLFAIDATGANYQTATVSAIAPGSLTLTWTKTGSPGPGTFNFSLRCSR